MATSRWKNELMHYGAVGLLVGIVVGAASMAFWLVLIRKVFVC
jgi:hypothetical protein